MKKLLFAAVVALIAIGLTASAYAVTPQTKTTAVTVNVGEIFNLNFGAPGVGGGPGEKARSSTSITFKTVDGSATWYYNNLATLDGNGDPNDGKSDVALVIKSNVHPYYVKLHKASDTLNNKLGYYVDKAFDGGAATTTETDGTVSSGTGFAGSTTWGELPTSPVTVYTSGSTIYAIYGVVFPVSYALVPTGLSAAGSPYSTTITYTLTTTP